MNRILVNRNYDLYTFFDSLKEAKGKRTTICSLKSKNESMYYLNPENYYKGYSMLFNFAGLGSLQDVLESKIWFRHTELSILKDVSGWGDDTEDVKALNHSEEMTVSEAITKIDWDRHVLVYKHGTNVETSFDYSRYTRAMFDPTMPVPPLTFAQEPAIEVLTGKHWILDNK